MACVRRKFLKLRFPSFSNLKKIILMLVGRCSIVEYMCMSFLQKRLLESISF